MTRKDYVLIAGVIKGAVMRTEYYKEIKFTEFIAEQLAKSFKLDNPRFDKTKFMQACGFETEL